MTTISPRSSGTVVLPPAGKVDVRVPELAGTVELATLAVTGPGGRPFLSIASSYPIHLLREWPVRDGRATVEGLPPGQWQLTATTADGRTWSGSATVPANGGDVSLELE